MEGQNLLILALCATLGVVFATPLQQNAFQPDYSNIPQCFQPKASGMCLAYFPSYYYSPATKSCEQFIYGGCGGNQNRFMTMAECLAACEGAEPEQNDFKLIIPSETFDRCSQPSDTGPCRAGLHRFYYNGDRCESFLYGGCEGNENNFKSVDECQKACGNTSSDEAENVVPSSENKSEEVAEEEQPRSEEVAGEEQPQSDEAEKNE